jgi:hypothetical protein
LWLWCFHDKADALEPETAFSIHVSLKTTIAVTPQNWWILQELILDDMNSSFEHSYRKTCRITIQKATNGINVNFRIAPKWVASMSFHQRPSIRSFRQLKGISKVQMDNVGPRIASNDWYIAPSAQIEIKRRYCFVKKKWCVNESSPIYISSEGKSTSTKSC